MSFNKYFVVDTAVETVKTTLFRIGCFSVFAKKYHSLDRLKLCLILEIPKFTFVFSRKHLTN